MSLSERAANFMMTFPEKKTSAESIRRIYIKNKVRKKKVKVTKIPNKKEAKRIKRSIQEAKAQLMEFRAKGFRIIYIDETMVTKSTIATHEWSQLNHNFEIDLK